ncbi:spindle pole body component Spc98p [[Candida] railenensis]|uniref:Spindle pole body component n=1 Tax=[Candida] railenensis TaxID=45579 RepID=A0A9P0QL33_9ASCO|nr:spindle pole body component Spc98p [[Candida] railenensis]
MGLDRNQLLKVYTTRLVNSLVPEEFGEEYINSISNELYMHIVNRPAGNEHDVGSFEGTLSQFKRFFFSQGRSHDWVRFQDVVDKLMRAKTVDQVEKYLVFFNGLMESSDFSAIQSSPYRQAPGDRVGPTAVTATTTGGSPLQGGTFSAIEGGRSLGSWQGHDSAVHASPPPPNATLQQHILPYYTSLDEQTIITYLSYTLLGIDSKIFTFTPTGTNSFSVQLSSSINHSYSGLLHNILEPALIYKKLSSAVSNDSITNSSSSPIKTAFLRSLEFHLNQYTTQVNKIFQSTSSQSSTLLSIYRQLNPLTSKLRILYTIHTNYFPLKGSEFLSKVYAFSKFGDLNIKQFATSLLVEVAKPYYEILETWILKGELIDNSNEEFFISYDFEGDNINDIIQFRPERIPNETFLNFKKELGVKIYQIGKMLIFLEKYCKELEWVNEFGIKYAHRVRSTLQRMTPNQFTSLILDQYNELLGYFTFLIQGKYQLFNHLQNFKTFLLMNSNDFIESLIENGMKVFNEPANSLTTSQLTKVLVDSINSSSIRNLNLEYQERLDARILNLNNGNGNGSIGWEVFTLEYKINDLPIEHILNYKSGLLGYLKMFNFLWKLKNLNYLLNAGYIESSRLMKDDLRNLNRRYNKLRRINGANTSIRDKKIIWIVKSFRSICLIRNQFTKFFNVLIKYLSIDVIDESFNEMITKKMKKSETRRRTNRGESTNESIVKPTSSFMKQISASIESQYELQAEFQDCDSVELTIDDLIHIHTAYLQKIIGCKLLNENEIGSISGESLILQIYDFLDITFHFIKGAEEFESLIIKYISLLSIDERGEEYMDEDFDEDLVELEENLKNIMDKTCRELYFQTFKPKLDLFTRDLRSTLELRELSRLF